MHLSPAIDRAFHANGVNIYPLRWHANIEDLKKGSSTVLIGAKGSGKTRLGARIEKALQPSYEAHRSLTMNPSGENRRDGILVTARIGVIP